MYPEVLADGAALGDRFVALVGAPDTAGWLPAAELFGVGLPAALAAVGRARGTDQPAVAGALLFEQYAQRLVAPTIAALHAHGAALDVRHGRIRVHLADGVLRRLAFAHGGRPLGPDRDAAHRRVAEDLVEGLDTAADAVHRHTRVGRRLLRGAVANAVASAYLHMSWPDDDRARYVPDAMAFLDRLPALGALVTVEAAHSAGRPWMYTGRHTCCLAFRTTANQARDQPYCSACPVLAPEVTRALFARATAAYAARRHGR